MLIFLLNDCGSHCGFEKLFSILITFSSQQYFTSWNHSQLQSIKTANFPKMKFSLQSVLWPKNDFGEMLFSLFPSYLQQCILIHVHRQLQSTKISKITKIQFPLQCGFKSQYACREIIFILIRSCLHHFFSVFSFNLRQPIKIGKIGYFSFKGIGQRFEDKLQTLH